MTTNGTYKWMMTTMITDGIPTRITAECIHGWLQMVTINEWLQKVFICDYKRCLYRRLTTQSIPTRMTTFGGHEWL